MISVIAKNYVAPSGAWEHRDAPDQGLAPLATSCRPSGADTAVVPEGRLYLRASDLARRRQAATSIKPALMVKVAEDGSGTSENSTMARRGEKES